MGLIRNTWICAVGVLVALATAGEVRAQAEWRFSDVDRFVAVGDIHGAYHAFETILRKAGVIDESLAWTGGATHLVLVGDILDRGAESRRAMDLIMRLEAEAPASGGRVDLALGNHELMNMTGDLRYVSPGEYAAFAGDETPELRASALAQYEATHAEDGSEGASSPEEGASPPAEDNAELEAEFDASYPPGFFAHRAAFAPDGKYGAWLLQHPMLVIVDGWAFVHGGLTDAVRKLGMDVNDRLIAQLSDYTQALEELIEAGIIGAGDSFYDHTAILDRFEARVAAGQATWPEGAEAAAATIRKLADALVFGPDSPAWYRGNVSCSPLIEQDRLLGALHAIDADRLVVGHTPTADARVWSRMDRSLFRIDTGMLHDYYGGRASALIVEGSDVSVLYEDEAASAEPVPQPRRVGLRPAGLTADELETFLASADVVSREPLNETTSRVRLERDGVDLDAVFVVAEQESFRPEVAAYRLDRLLGLDMVPVTVSRTLDGQPGSLQYSPPRVITETERVANRLGASAWCPLGDQFQAVYVFDSLIFNEGRTADRIHYSTDNFQLILVGHDRAFSTARGRPPHLAKVELEITPAWAKALADLDQESLTAALGDVLDRRRIRALLGRRDGLLEAAGG